jgi:LmbE family N-acetylglucosaminyl deacetylase
VKLRLLTVHAYPDDESSKGAATSPAAPPKASTSSSPPAQAANAAPSSTPPWTGPKSGRTSPPSAARKWPPPATSKLYYHLALTRPWFQALHDALGAESTMGPIVDSWPDTETLATTTKIHCADHFDTLDRALLAHTTQVTPGEGFMAHPRTIEREVWPTEDYHLARTHVETALPEDDLFRACAARK